MWEVPRCHDSPPFGEVTVIEGVVVGGTDDEVTVM